MAKKRRPLKRPLSKRKVSVIINVNDSTQEEFLTDLSRKVNDVIKTQLVPVLLDKCGLIVANLVRTHLVTRGLLTAAGEETTEGYFVRSVVTLDVLDAILNESGIDLDVDIAPRSVREREYKQLFSENQDSNK